jgi:hypothetical protein
LEEISSCGRLQKVSCDKRKDRDVSADLNWEQDQREERHVLLPLLPRLLSRGFSAIQVKGVVELRKDLPLFEVRKAV